MIAKHNIPRCASCGITLDPTDEWWCQFCRNEYEERRERLEKEKSQFPPEEQSFGPALREILGEDWREKSGYERHVKAAEHRSMAHLAHSLGAFKSIGEARRNGVSGDVEPGVLFIKIRGYRHRIVIE